MDRIDVDIGSPTKTTRDVDIIIIGAILVISMEIIPIHNSACHDKDEGEAQGDNAVARRLQSDVWRKKRICG